MASSDIVEEIFDEINFFAPLIQQSVIVEEFDRQYEPQNNITAGAPIDFLIKGVDGYYLDLEHSDLYVRAKITKANGANMDANVKAGPVNLTLHSLFQDIIPTLGSVQANIPSNMYPYRSYMETALNYSKETQETRLLSEGWVKDTAGSMAVTDLAGANTGLRDRATWFATSNVVEFVGRPHCDIFHQSRLIPPKIDLTLKLIPAPSQFVCISAPPGQNAQQEQFKVVIEHAKFTVRMKRLADAAEVAIQGKLQAKKMRLPYTKVEMRQFTIPANVTSQVFENVFNNALPDLVVIGLVNEENFGGHYNRNPFDFQAFGVNRINVYRSGIERPMKGYTPDFGNRRFIEAYKTLTKELGYNIGDKALSLTPTEWANGFTFYAFKVTDGPIGSGADSPRSPIPTGDLKVSIGFSAPNNHNIKVVVLAQSVGYMFFDQFKIVTLV